MALFFVDFWMGFVVVLFVIGEYWGRLHSFYMYLELGWSLFRGVSAKVDVLSAKIGSLSAKIEVLSAILGVLSAVVMALSAKVVHYRRCWVFISESYFRLGAHGVL